MTSGTSLQKRNGTMFITCVSVQFDCTYNFINPQHFDDFLVALIFHFVCQIDFNK